mgnify:CR=1 FL=1
MEFKDGKAFKEKVSNNSTQKRSRRVESRQGDSGLSDDDVIRRMKIRLLNFAITWIKMRERSRSPVKSGGKCYKKRTNKIRTLSLRPLHSSGKWSGENPFRTNVAKEDMPHGKIAIITRATLRWNRLLSFWAAVPKASKAIEEASGVHFYKGIGEWPFIQQATISIWENLDAVHTFAYKGKAHSEIVKNTRKKKWYKEDLFSRFELLNDVTYE